MLTMVTNTLHSQGLSDDFANRIGPPDRDPGRHGGGLFDPTSLPDLMTELAVSDEARKRSVTIQVMQRSGAASSAASQTRRSKRCREGPRY